MHTYITRLNVYEIALNVKNSNTNKTDMPLDLFMHFNTSFKDKYLYIYILAVIKWDMTEGKQKKKTKKLQ